MSKLRRSNDNMIQDQAKRLETIYRPSIDTLVEGIMEKIRHAYKEREEAYGNYNVSKTDILRILAEEQLNRPSLLDQPGKKLHIFFHYGCDDYYCEKTQPEVPAGETEILINKCVRMQIMRKEGDMFPLFHLTVHFCVPLSDDTQSLTTITVLW